MDLTWIEVMPMGDMGEQRGPPGAVLVAGLMCAPSTPNLYAPSPTIAERTGGPARYVRLEETGQKIGFITPLTHNFCESCNRVRLTCTGEFFLCLGQEDIASSARRPLRAHPDDRRPVA